jgi:hypothetical protein
VRTLIGIAAAVLVVGAPSPDRETTRPTTPPVAGAPGGCPAFTWGTIATAPQFIPASRHTQSAKEVRLTVEQLCLRAEETAST